MQGLFIVKRLNWFSNKNLPNFVFFSLTYNSFFLVFVKQHLIFLFIYSNI